MDCRWDAVIEEVDVVVVLLVVQMEENVAVELIVVKKEILVAETNVVQVVESTQEHVVMVHAVNSLVTLLAVSTTPV